MQTIELGKFHREWGVEGVVSGYFYHPKSDLIASLKHVYINTPKPLTQLTLVSPPKPHQRLFLFRFKEITTPEAAKQLRQCSFYYPEAALPQAPAGDFYWYEVMDAEVWSREGECLGVLKRIEGSDSVRLMVIAPQSGPEFFYPAVASLIDHYDRDKRRLIVEPIEGLV